MNLMKITLKTKHCSLLLLKFFNVASSHLYRFSPNSVYRCPKIIWPILFSQSWDNWGYSWLQTGRVTNSLTPYTSVCVFFLSVKFATSLLTLLAGTLNNEKNLSFHSNIAPGSISPWQQPMKAYQNSELFHGGLQRTLHEIHGYSSM